MLSREFYTAVSGCCEVGDHRSVNQDNILILQKTFIHSAFERSTAGLFLVADGCGGLTHGEKVSGMIAEKFQRFWEMEMEPLLFPQRQIRRRIPAAVLNWLEQINGEAYNFGQEMKESVGSTLALLLTVNHDYFLFNVGDSRVYLKRRGLLRQLSEDQTQVADMLRNHEITPEEAEDYPGRNVLTMCVGFFEQMHVFCAQGKLYRGDVFLLCSDGLYNHLPEGEDLSRLIPDRISPDSAKQLRNRIEPGMAKDNVSVILAELCAR